MKKTIEKYLQASDEVSFKYNKAGAKIWYRAHAIIETGAIDTGKAYAWSCDHDIKINRFQAALILEKYGLTIDQFINAEKEFYATRYPNTDNEPNPDDYAVSSDALEVAVNAEIQNANNVKINDLKWEIRYTEGSINDLDKNHIAHAPNDQSLQERRTELVNELDNLNAQLAELLPTEVNTNSEYKYYIQSRRPIAGAVPNGYISATQGEMKVHSLRSDGSISPVPRKVVFGVVVYDHPLSDQQIINYDLHVDPLNPKVEPATTELSDEEIAEIKRRSQINAIKSRIATYERAIERQYDQELENSLIAAKAQLAEIEPANTPEADHIADTGIKEEQPMTIEIPAEGTHKFTIGDDTVCFFDGEFHSVFSAKYHMAIVRDLVGCFSYCIYNDGDTEVFNVREHAVSYDNFMETLHQRGNREKLLALRKEYIITDRLSENNSSLWYVNGKRSSQVKVWNLLQSYGLTLAEFLAEEEAYINERVAASFEQLAIKKQADFLYDKIKRECASIDDSTTDRDEVFNLLPDLDNDVEKVWLTKGELDDLTAKFRAAVSIIPVTTRIEKMLPVTITITKQNSAKPFDMGFGAFAKYSIVQWITGLRIMRNFSTLGVYETPSQIEEVIRRLETAIVRGDKAFTFPTVEELDPNPDDERELYDICNQALKEVA